MHSRFPKSPVALGLALAVGCACAADAAPASPPGPVQEVAPPLKAAAPKPARKNAKAHVPVQGPEQELVMFVGDDQVDSGHQGPARRHR